jgi:hypothetical protein
MVKTKFPDDDLFILKDLLGPKVTCISKKNASAIAVTFEMKMSKVGLVDK